MAQDALKYKVIAIGGSAGSLEAILKIIADAVVSNVFYIVIVHRKNDADSVLSDLFKSHTHLTVKEVEDKEPVLPGHLYVAPPDYHLLLENEFIFSLDASEKVHHSRPSIDVTFESVAHIFGDAAIGILLSGANADGAQGLYKINKAGGFTIVQDPVTAEVDYMPKQALLLFKPNAIVRSDQMPAFINKLLY